MKMPTPQFDLSSAVYSKINPDFKGMVTGYLVRPGPTLIYLVTWSEDLEERESWGTELTDEKDFGPTE